MDPLSLLRSYVTDGHADQVVLAGERVDFGGRYSFPRAIPTSYKSNQGKEGFYDLESLVAFVRHITTGSKYREYLQTAKSAKLMAVSVLDRKDLEDYLTGKKDRSEYIQLAIPDFQVEALEQPSKRARLEGEGGEGGAGPSSAAEAGALAGLAAHELQLRDRNSMLAVPNRNLTKVLALLANVQKEEQRKAAAARPHKPIIPVKPSGRYERATQQDARLRQMGAEVLGGAVQTGFVTASAAGGGSGSGAAPPPPPPGAAAPPQPAAAAQPPPRHGGGHAARHDRHHHHHAARPGGGRAAPGGPPYGGQWPRSGTPIIMVPPALTSLVNMYNVQPLLEQGVFRTVEECKAELAASGGKKQDLIKITRSMGRQEPVAYHVTDKEPERKEDWKRVVAVFCLGKAWQFKKWPFKGAAEGHLVETFSRVRGVFLHFNDEKVDPTVKSWNVQVLGINRQGRHRDVTVVQEFWSGLDSFLQGNKSTLLY